MRRQLYGYLPVSEFRIITAAPVSSILLYCNWCGEGGNSAAGVCERLALAVLDSAVGESRTRHLDHESDVRPLGDRATLPILFRRKKNRKPVKLRVGAEHVNGA